MISPNGQEGWREAVAIAVVAVLATLVKIANQPPQKAAELLWQLVIGLALCSGGWLIAKGLGGDGWAALAAGYVAGVLGADSLKRILNKWTERTVKDRE